MNTRKTGEAYEEAAALYLKRQGIIILEKNYRSRGGEIDLVGRDGEYLVFFEVKYRRDSRMGYPAEAVGLEKQRRICRTARWYLYERRCPESIPIRFDVVAICGKSVNWYQNAFDYIG